MKQGLEMESLNPDTASAPGANCPSRPQRQEGKEGKEGKEQPGEMVGQFQRGNINMAEIRAPVENGKPDSHTLCLLATQVPSN